ncbi:hypothetical protein SAM9427_10720 [Streptomyces sp. ETH9427]|nr:hypothetical protein SAM9427_10720 [Streptomyces sp. ETH9427]
MAGAGSWGLVAQFPAPLRGVPPQLRAVVPLGAMGVPPARAKPRVGRVGAAAPLQRRVRVFRG